MLHRNTHLSGQIDISLDGRNLKADIAGHGFGITAPDIRSDTDHEILGWVALAAWPCLHKNIEHALPEEVRKASLILSRWVQDGCLLSTGGPK
ncbi:MAG: hypothetical protein HT580_16665 [Dechloromonas sp.]|nr:MAG: hypothetical protein HT580_16665 [Dechloromonas sp.]